MREEDPVVDNINLAVPVDDNIDGELVGGNEGDNHNLNLQNIKKQLI